MASRKRRVRTSHVGVKLKHRLAPSGVRTWVARWRDPLTGAETQQSLDALGLTTAEARRRWCIDRAAANDATAAAVAAGTATAERVGLRAAVDRFLAASGAKPSTVRGYASQLSRLVAWADAAGVRQVQDLHPRHLAAYRDSVVKSAAKAPARGSGRGARKATTRRLSPVATNMAFTVAKIFLTWARRSGLAPNLGGDALRDVLRPVRVDRPAVDFLRPPQIRQLLQAARRHDAVTFKATRDEHAGRGEAGSTPRYEAAAPFVLLSLLLGTRLQELTGLRWSEVDLEAQEIRLPPERVKTAAARTVTLAEAPTAIKVLRKLRLQVPGDRVFPAWTDDVAKKVRQRLVVEFGAPDFTWRTPRRTCAAILTNAAAIYGGASAYRSAKRAGHSVAIAERHYVDLLRDLSMTAKTLEAAAGIKDIADKIVADIGGRRGGADSAYAQHHLDQADQAAQDPHGFAGQA